ncbi:alanine racemase [Methylocystis parvus]|uniref:Alanine racemase n=1 Tax=Methylocystis parvus TaxID=134 RepID=A0A6B8M3U0_9HYPH|nr:alanine racemase [Methylocystis parvus]QGM98564.1 alanine racemase [Methylocystis parvus]WBK01094.1 alanine racemase [Methylocystis parvus OBBP]
MGIISPAKRSLTAPAATEPVETGLLTIDLSALAANWRMLAALAGSAQCGAVVKADGYGLGQAAVMRALSGAGCKTFFVANLLEGETARALAPDAAIYVLDGVVPGCAPRLAAAELRPCIGSFAELEEWAAAGVTFGRKLEAALHFDTGMNRLGFAPRDAADVAIRARGIAPTLIMSHFLSSQSADDPVNDRQIADFLAARTHFPGLSGSIANSSGVFLPQKPHFDLVRPGYALYGGNPTPQAANPMRPVARLLARIVSVRDLTPGETVGYDGVWKAPRPSRVATIGAGYADGLPISATAAPDKPAGEAIVGGARCPFIGRVSMDYIVLDVTDAPKGAAERGQWVELLGETIDVEALAGRARTIGYEVLTRLGRRYSRRYAG